jgi:hypothetical protein
VVGPCAEVEVLSYVYASSFSGVSKHLLLMGILYEYLLWIVVGPCVEVEVISYVYASSFSGVSKCLLLLEIKIYEYNTVYIIGQV